MKRLVDILARELAEWPKESAKAMQDFDKEIRFFDSVGDQMASFDFYAEELACDACDEKTFAGGGTEVTRAEWQAAVDALNAPKVVEWDGEGNPPVGTVVVTIHKNKEITVKILAYGNHRFEPCVMAADMSLGFEGKMFAWILDQCEFMPIRTAEQVAAEEREKAIKDLYYTINWNDDSKYWDEGVSAARKADYAKAIDAGYTKVEK